MLTALIPEVIETMVDAPLPCTVWVRPVTDTVAVSYSVDGGQNYDAWPNGAVVVYADDSLLSGVTHIKFTATTGGTSTYGIL
jgi:hypothetical protein